MTRVASMPVMAKASWVKKVIEQLTRAQEAIAEIRTGPLGWVERGVVNDPDRTSPPPNSSRLPSPRPEERQIAAHYPATLPVNLMLAVDGVGSFLVVRNDVVRVGAISATMPCDVAFVAEPTLPTVTFERVEDDYFLRTRTGEKKLLASGEKLELSPRCRLVFRLPTRASTSAVLDLTGARLPRSDVRRVVLMDQDVVLGLGATSHVGVEQASGQVVLYVRNEQLFVRTSSGTSEHVALGAHMNVGNISFVVTAANERR
jgi:hypothetical protein